MGYCRIAAACLPLLASRRTGRDVGVKLSLKLSRSSSISASSHLCSMHGWQVGTEVLICVAVARKEQQQIYQQISDLRS